MHCVSDGVVVSCVPENESTHDIVARMTPTNKEAFLEKEGMRVKKKNEETICTCFPISVS